MPRKDHQAQLAYQREWYAKHPDRVKAKTKRRKWNEYAGVCGNCGGKTIGYSPGKAAAFCSKPECRSAARKGKKVFSDAGVRGRAKQLHGDEGIILPWAQK